MASSRDMRNGADGLGALSDSALRLIYDLACGSERRNSPVTPDAAQAAEAKLLATRGLLSTHEGYDCEHLKCVAYTVTDAGMDAFNLAIAARPVFAFREAADL